MSDIHDELGDVEYGFVEPPASTAFEGWHRPRKHFVRMKQWVACTRDLLEERPATEALRYFGLPGVDLLDVREIYQSVCAPQGRDLLFRGHAQEVSFNRDAATRLEITLQQLKQLPGVDAGSDVKGDPLEACASRRSVAYQEIQRHGPYDIINLDLCDGFFGRAPGRGSLYTAVENLLALQARRTRPWLLFVSGVVDDSAVHADVRDVLESLVIRAAEECPDLEMELGVLIGHDLSELSLASLPNREFAVVVNFALLVWLSQRAQDGHPNKVRLKSAFGYRTLPEAPESDFFSLAFKFSPVIGPVATDPSGLADTSTVETLDHCESQAAGAKRLGRTVDVDQRLRADTSLRDEMVAGSRILLEWARFNPDEYLAWVAEYET